jgi:hypothetical protein
MVKEQEYNANQENATESEKGYGLLSSLTSTGTDSFEFISAAGPHIDGDTTARKHYSQKMEYKGNNFIPRLVGKGNNNNMNFHYLERIDKGYVLCTTLNSGTFHCRGENDVSNSFAASPGPIA